MRYVYTRVIFPVLLVLVLACGAGVVAFQIPKRVRSILEVRDYLASEDFSIQIGNENGDIAVALSRREIMGEDYFSAMVGDIRIYYHDQSVYLDNGRGYDLEALLPELPDETNGLLWLLMLTDIQWVGDVTTFTVTAQNLELVEQFVPEIAPFLMGASLRLEEGLQLVIPEVCQVEVSRVAGSEVTIPTQILMEMKADTAHPVFQILPLLRACLDMAEAAVFGAEAEISLECGPLPIHDNAQLYGTSDGLWLRRSGSSFAIGLDGIVQNRQAFLGLGYILCRDALITQEKDESIYRLDLDANAVSGFFSRVLPEASGLGIRFADAQCIIHVSKDQFSRISLRCSGEMPFLVLQLPIAFSVDLIPMEGTITLPQDLPSHTAD